MINRIKFISINIFPKGDASLSQPKIAGEFLFNYF